MPTLTANPAALKSAYSGLYALSEKEIKAIIVTAMRDAAGLTTSALNENAACFACMAKKDMLIAITAMILNQQNSSKSVTQWRADAKCLSCAPDKTLEAAFVYLFAANFQATAL
jgi:hypothetical protein